jgi:signal transduction histidine kinase
VKLHELLLEVMALHAPSMCQRIRHVVDCDVDLLGYFDEALIMRVLHNLVGNSVRYCNPSGLIRLAARHWEEDGHTGVEISVQNSGPQIPDGLLPKLFKKYALGKDGQRGLGLYFCRLALDAHGGSVRYEPLSTGPCFILRLPDPPTSV